MYNYETQRKFIFTEEGQRDFLTVRDHVENILKSAGCIRMQEAISCICGLSWDQLACVDRLVEIGELKEVEQSQIAGQHRIFISGK